MVDYFDDVFLKTICRINQWEFRVTWNRVGQFCGNASHVLSNTCLLMCIVKVLYSNGLLLTALHSCFAWRNSLYWAKTVSLSWLQDHTQTSHSVGLLYTGDQPDVENLPNNIRDRNPCLRCDSNPQSLQASGRRPPPWIVRQLKSARLHSTLFIWSILNKMGNIWKE